MARIAPVQPGQRGEPRRIAPGTLAKPFVPNKYAAKPKPKTSSATSAPRTAAAQVVSSRASASPSPGSSGGGSVPTPRPAPSRPAPAKTAPRRPAKPPADSVLGRAQAWEGDAGPKDGQMGDGEFAAFRRNYSATHKKHGLSNAQLAVMARYLKAKNAGGALFKGGGIQAAGPGGGPDAPPAGSGVKSPVGGGQVPANIPAATGGSGAVQLPASPAPASPAPASREDRAAGRRKPGDPRRFHPGAVSTSRGTVWVGSGDAAVKNMQNERRAQLQRKKKKPVRRRPMTGGDIG